MTKDAETLPDDNPDGEAVALAPEELLRTLSEENLQLKDRLLRATAETENVRRRLEREKLDIGSYAVTGFARDLLAVADNLRRGPHRDRGDRA